jgi:dTDP-4-amino-4,6-dideoxygalactose transaminase
MSADDLSAKRAKLNAVIAVHMFGNLCDMPSMLDAAQGIPIIEDCAQSLGSRCDGRLAGSYGAVAAFSFRSGKYLAVGEGGALFTCDAEINRRLIALIEAMQTPSFLEECKHVAETYLRSLLRNRPLYGLIGYRIWSMYNKITDYTEKSPIVLSQSFKSDLAITLKRLPYLDSAIQRQRANADFYSRNLNLEPIMLCRERNGAFYNRFMYPITFPSETQRDAMAAYLFNRGIGAIHPYKDIAEVAANHYGYDGSCPVAEQIAKRVLVLPSNYSLNTHTVEYISHCVNEGWKNLSSYKN